MPVDFDTVPNRRGTNCFKYDFAREMGMPEDVLPLWVADMDFRTAPPCRGGTEETGGTWDFRLCTCT